MNDLTLIVDQMYVANCVSFDLWHTSYQDVQMHTPSIIKTRRVIILQVI